MTPNPDQLSHIRILMYHHVGPYGKVKHLRGLHTDVERFSRQMRYLANSSLSVISMDHAVQVIKGEKSLDGIGILITFDDGFQDFHDHAWPILKSHNLPATMYAVADRLGCTQDWGSLSPIADNRLMDASTLRALAAEGLAIGGHTATHPHLDTLPHNQRDYEIGDAKAKLEDILGREVLHFAYPYGDYDADARDRIAAAGFHSAVTTKRMRAERAANVYEMPRIAISYQDGPLRFYRKTHRRYNNVTMPDSI